MTNSLAGKKLLVLGGAFPHCKIVEAAHKLGIEVHVTDYLEESPAKSMADVQMMYNVMDVDGIVEYCKNKQIDGVLSVSLDICQIPYQRICQALGKPCFGTAEQYHLLTNKTAFKNLCRQYNVDIINSYTPEEIEAGSSDVVLPVIVKPSDSSGSKGQTVCYDLPSAREAVRIAQAMSTDGHVIIEQYMENALDFCSAYLIENGNVHLIRTCDRYTGSREFGLNHLCAVAVNPSGFTRTYLERVNDRVVAMLQGIGIKNGPVFMQGMIDGDTVRFYDPGFRFSGGEYERLLKEITGVDLTTPLIRFALTGSMGKVTIPDDVMILKGKRITHYDPLLRPGKVNLIHGMNEIMQSPNVVSFFSRYTVGETVPNRCDVSRRFAEICFISDGREEQIKQIRHIQDTLHILDENGNEMVCDKFKVDRLL